MGCEKKRLCGRLVTNVLQEDILILTVLAWPPVVWHLDKDKQGALGLFITDEQLNKEAAFAQFFLINNYVIWSLHMVAQCSQPFWFKNFKIQENLTVYN